MKSISIIPVESQTQNPVLIRMNCLAIACLDERYADKIPLAAYYEEWVLSGKAKEYGKVVISDSSFADLKKSGVIDETQVFMTNTK